MKELIKEASLKKEEKETKEMMDIIHKNAQKGRDKYIMNKNIETLRKERNERNEKHKKTILITTLVLLMFALLFIDYKYTQHSINECMANGNAENFCVFNK